MSLADAFGDNVSLEPVHQPIADYWTQLLACAEARRAGRRPPILATARAAARVIRSLTQTAMGLHHGQGDGDQALPQVVTALEQYLADELEGFPRRPGVGTQVETTATIERDGRVYPRGTQGVVAHDSAAGYVVRLDHGRITWDLMRDDDFFRPPLRSRS